MTPEEKKLLMTDLAGRIPHGIMVRCSIGKLELNQVAHALNASTERVRFRRGLTVSVENVRPYLRRKNTMTAKEYIEYQKRIKVIQDYEGTLYWCDTPESLDWLDENGFDYRGLLDLGLAVDMKELFEK